MADYIKLPTRIKLLKVICAIVGTMMLYRGIINFTQYPDFWERTLLGLVFFGGVFGMYLTYFRRKEGYWLFTALNFLVGIWFIFILEDVWHHHVLPHIIFSAIFIPFYKDMRWSGEQPDDPPRFLDSIIADILKLGSQLTGIIGTLLTPLLSVIASLNIFSSTAHWLNDKVPKLWSALLKLPILREPLSQAVFQRFAGAAPPRPHPISMSHDYTSWVGLTDKSFSGRHIPPRDQRGDKAILPTEEKLLEVFLRQGGENMDSDHFQQDRSSFLFAEFAQWFTDSFLRTCHGLDFDNDGKVKTDKNHMPVRSPDRVKCNDSNHEIDLCQIYGVQPDQTDMLRLHSETHAGRLKSQELSGGEYQDFLLATPPIKQHENRLNILNIKDEFNNLHPEPLLRFITRKASENSNGYETLFATGLEHGNSTIGNSLFNTIFLREHNRIADMIADEYGWGDERVFQVTRNTMIVLLLKVVVMDYIRHIAPLNLPLTVIPGMAEKQDWYRRNRIHIEFNLLYRWHELVPDRFNFLSDDNHHFAFLHNNDWLINKHVANTVTEFSQQPAGKIILGNTPRSLDRIKAGTITLMRQANLAPYNAYRKRFGLSRAKRFEDINDDPAILEQLKELYNDDIEQVEWYVGMYAEKHTRGMIMGELMLTMVAHDAFTHALTNPLLAAEVFVPETFSDVGWKVINETSTLEDIVKRVVSNADGLKCNFSFAST